MAQYSASVLELETVGCFLALQEIQLEPKKVQKPVVGCHLVGQPAQETAFSKNKNT